MLDANPTSWESFDAQTASTLFWEAVPFLIHYTDREDQHEELVVRVLSGTTRQNHNLRVLRIHLSSEQDLFFLHTLEVSEEDFQTLKVEQGILVDFANFSGKVIGLLQRCIASRDVELPTFRAVLSVRGGTSLFQVVETNDFKQLPHITLTFRPGNDTAIKQFLAFRLTEVKCDCSGLKEQLDSVQADRNSLASELAENRAEGARLREEHERSVLEFGASQKQTAAEHQEMRARERNELKQQLEREREAAEEKLRGQLETVGNRTEELDKENRNLRELKYNLDSKVSELSHKLGASEGQNRALGEENRRIKALQQQLARDKSEQEVEVTEVRTRLHALEEKNASQAELVQQQAARLKEMEGALRSYEDRCTDLREIASGHETRAKEAGAEVLKGNQIIERLNSDLQLAKEKVKRKQAIIVRQEEELLAREKALAAARQEAEEHARGAAGLRSERDKMGEEIQDLRGKLEESRQQLKGNEQMIRWLNQQVNDAQLTAGGRSSSSSRFAFRPSSIPDTPALPLPTAAAAAASGRSNDPARTPYTGAAAAATARLLSSGAAGSLPAASAPRTGSPCFAPFAPSASALGPVAAAATPSLTPGVLNMGTGLHDRSWSPVTGASTAGAMESIHS